MAPASTQKILAKLVTTDPLWKPIEMRGRFYVDVDDSASIYVNGTRGHGAQINRSNSMLVITFS